MIDELVAKHEATTRDFRERVTARWAADRAAGKIDEAEHARLSRELAAAVDARLAEVERRVGAADLGPFPGTTAGRATITAYGSTPTESLERLELTLVEWRQRPALGEVH